MPRAPGPNIVGGPFVGGNAWLDCAGVDADLDGFGDEPHLTPVGADALPLSVTGPAAALQT